MNTATATESEKNASALEVPQPKTKRATAKKAKATKKAGLAGKPASKPKTDRANKKAEINVMMKRAKGATLAEIMAVTKWQAHTSGRTSRGDAGLACVRNLRLF